MRCRWIPYDKCAVHQYFLFFKTERPQYFQRKSQSQNVRYHWIAYEKYAGQLDLVRNPHPKMCGATGLPMKNVPYYWIS